LGRVGHRGVLAICLVMTITVASLSWFLLENPINSLKNRFRVVPSAVLAGSIPATM
jgi:peptidoglycan/LPS O-acetylase OafA/YrhL